MADGVLGGFPGGYFGAGASALGAGADLYSFFDNLRRQEALQKLQDILSNPAKLQAYIQGYYQPMSGAAVAATNRDLGANWAVQTGGAPGGAMNQYTADAFAKLESDRYNQAAQQALYALTGAMGGYKGGPQSPMGNLGGILKILTELRGANAPSPRQVTPTAPTTPFPMPGSTGQDNLLEYGPAFSTAA